MYISTVNISGTPKVVYSLSRGGLILNGTNNCCCSNSTCKYCYNLDTNRPTVIKNGVIVSMENFEDINGTWSYDADGSAPAIWNRSSSGYNAIYCAYGFPTSITRRFSNITTVRTGTLDNSIIFDLVSNDDNECYFTPPYGSILLFGIQDEFDSNIYYMHFRLNTSNIINQETTVTWYDNAPFGTSYPTSVFTTTYLQYYRFTSEPISRTTYFNAINSGDYSNIPVSPDRIYIPQNNGWSFETTNSSCSNSSCGVSICDGYGAFFDGYPGPTFTGQDIEQPSLLTSPCVGSPEQYLNPKTLTYQNIFPKGYFGWEWF